MINIKDLLKEEVKIKSNKIQKSINLIDKIDKMNIFNKGNTYKKDNLINYHNSTLRIVYITI